MNTFDWKITIKMNLLLLKFGGLWPEKNLSYKLNNLYAVRAIFCISLFLIVDALSQAVNIYFLRDDFQAVTSVIYLLFTKFVTIFKVLKFTNKINVLKRFMNCINSNIFQPQNHHQRIMIIPTLEAWKKMFTALFLMSFSTIALWGVFPLLDQNQEKKLPFVAWYPYDTHRWPFYEITYVYQVLSISYCGVVSVGIDTYVSALNMYIGAQFDILCDNLKNLKFNKNTNRNLRHCIAHHKVILR